ncbi:hypothetical protein GCM10023340_38620 [Nocardioides marinquilinus]|uniref:Uncharacterized protein n=1 Tax=Nocardioides marinquilinus TaxID=1210400 RepID=A0ABP9Q0F0_9ACTN
MKRRADDGVVKTYAHPLDFKPRHCAGTGCAHDHAGASVPLPPGGLVMGGMLARTRRTVARVVTGRDPRLADPRTPTGRAS